MVVGVLGHQKTVIAVSEFFLLHFFVGKGLNNPDSGQSVLQTGIDVADSFPVIHKSCLHPAVLS